MAITIKHLTLGQMGLYAESAEELTQSVTSLQNAGYTVESNVDEPSYVATILYSRTANMQKLVRHIRQLIA
jgi:hypothetical protein